MLSCICFDSSRSLVRINWYRLQEWHMVLFYAFSPNNRAIVILHDLLFYLNFKLLTRIKFPLEDILCFRCSVNVLAIEKDKGTKIWCVSAILNRFLITPLQSPIKNVCCSYSKPYAVDEIVTLCILITTIFSENNFLLRHNMTGMSTVHFHSLN